LAATAGDGASPTGDGNVASDALGITWTDAIAGDGRSPTGDGDVASGGLIAVAPDGGLRSERVLSQVSTFSRRVAVVMESIATAARSGANSLNGCLTEAMAGSPPSRL
jgi:hypothetical protein